MILSSMELSLLDHQWVSLERDVSLVVRSSSLINPSPASCECNDIPRNIDPTRLNDRWLDTLRCRCSSPSHVGYNNGVLSDTLSVSRLLSVDEVDVVIWIAVGVGGSVTMVGRGCELSNGGGTCVLERSLIMSFCRVDGSLPEVMRKMPRNSVKQPRTNLMIILPMSIPFPYIRAHTPPMILPVQVGWIIIIEITINNSTSSNGRDGKEHKLSGNNSCRVVSLHGSIEIFDLHKRCKDEDCKKHVRYGIPNRYIVGSALDHSHSTAHPHTTYVNNLYKVILSKEDNPFVATTVYAPIQAQ